MLRLLERLDADLGNPQRHLRRLLDQAELPVPGNPSTPRPPRRLDAHAEEARAVVRELTAIQAEGSDASPAAARVLRAAHGGGGRTGNGHLSAAGVESVLGAVDLETKPNAPSYRQDAYGRLLCGSRSWNGSRGARAPCS